MRGLDNIDGGTLAMELWHNDRAYPFCLLGLHAWLYDSNDHTKRSCTRLRCSHGKARLGCRHFWREWNHRRFQLYTNACRRCRSKAFRKAVS